jgi:hypothetical protein
MEVLDRQIDQDPMRLEQMRRMETYTEEYVREFLNSSTRNTSCRTIPVVVTVVYSNSQQNISDAQIQSQIDVLNTDYAGTNGDFAPPSEFAGVAAGNTGIQFTLQEVRRYSNSRSSWGTNDLVKSSYPPVSPTTTINMWVCNIGGGILGYAQFPGGSSSTDGVVMSPQYFGSSDYGSGFYLSAPFDKGRTTTHEVGHYLNLRHIWGDGGCSVDDYVDDTPRAASSNYGCPSYPTNSCTSQSGNDMTMNFMDYTDDNCMFMFSAGQSARMWACLSSTRTSLGSDCGSGGGGGGGGTSDCVGAEVTLSLLTDNYGSETSWTLQDANGTTVESGSGYGNNTNYTFNWNLADGDYTFTINDSYGDGICCSYGNGSYSLDEGNTNIANGGSFTSSESIDFCVESSGGGGGGDPCPTIDLDGYTINSYGNSQDKGNGSVNNGVLVLTGNSWKAIDFNYTVTSNTVIEVDFGSTVEGEIHGIGFDNNNGISSNRTFKLHGTQNWGYTNYDNYSNVGSWTTYTIPVGQFYTGSFDRLFFTNDDDANSSGNSYFTNIKIYEGSCSSSREMPQEVTTILLSDEGEDLLVPSQVYIYPNPANNILNIDLNMGTDTRSARIIDATGRTLWAGQLKKGTSSIEVSQLNTGLYHFTVVNTDGTTITKKFIKE